MSTSPPPSRRSRGRTAVLLVLATVAAACSLGALTAGGMLLWADGERDADGYLTSDREAVDTAGRAITSGRIDLDLDGSGALLDLLGAGEGRLTADAGRDVPTFVGIARTADAERYLRGVRRTTVTDVDLDLGRDPDLRHADGGGGRRPPDPGTRDFWVAEAQGDGAQTLTWDVRDGEWTAVVMRADAARGIDATVSAGLKLPGLLAPGLAALGTGLALLGVAATLLWLALRRPGEGTEPAREAPTVILGPDAYQGR